MLPANQWVKKEIKREVKNILRPIKMEIQHIKSYGMQHNQFSKAVIVINGYIKKQKVQINT